jgi:phage shock protein PspC (stress-responsive transcriptional regulator)
MNKFKFVLENNLFGVCSKIGEKLNFSAKSIRMYFIYASFFTLGSPVIIYLVLAFWMEIKNQVRSANSSSIWEI